MSSEAHDGSTLLVTLAVLVVALVYLRGWSRLRQLFPDLLNARRLAAFLGGLLSLWIAIGSPFASMDHRWLTAHMAQHLLLMTVAAPLILLGAPVITLFRGLPGRPTGAVLELLLRNPMVQQLSRRMTHPWFCWLVGTATVIGWHVPALFELAIHSTVWHEVECACFFTAGFFFWWPVVQPWPGLAASPRWGIPVYLFLATLPCDALSAFLAFCDRVVYPHYLSPHRLSNLSPLADQAAAGALMWIWVTFAYLAPAVMITLQNLSPQRGALNAEVS
jgi:putative membrane protein